MRIFTLFAALRFGQELAMCGATSNAIRINYLSSLTFLHLCYFKSIGSIKS